MPFRDIIGQPRAVTHIQDALSQGRLAHALLIRGPEGVGKLALAQAIAQFVNCEMPENGDACGRCASCLKIKKLVHPDVKYILPIISKKEGNKTYLSDDYVESFRGLMTQEPYFPFTAWQQALDGDNKQLFISVAEIRELKRGIFLKAFEAKTKVVIVWHADLVNVQGANAFLKLLEEPPDDTLIILTCADMGQLLPTIVSRCQQVQLGRIPREEVQAYVQQRRKLEPAWAAEVAAVADGSIGAAFEFLEDSSQKMSETYINWLRSVYAGDYQKIATEAEAFARQSKEYQKLFLQLAVRKLRSSLMVGMGLEHLAGITETEAGFHRNFARVIDAEKAEFMSQVLDAALRHIGGNANPQMELTTVSIQLHQAMRGT